MSTIHSGSGHGISGYTASSSAMPWMAAQNAMESAVGSPARTVPSRWPRRTISAVGVFMSKPASSSFARSGMASSISALPMSTNMSAMKGSSRKKARMLAAAPSKNAIASTSALLPIIAIGPPTPRPISSS